MMEIEEPDNDSKLTRSPAISPQSELSREANSPDVSPSKNPMSCFKIEKNVSIRISLTILWFAYPNPIPKNVEKSAKEID